MDGKGRTVVGCGVESLCLQSSGESVGGIGTRAAPTWGWGQVFTSRADGSGLPWALVILLSIELGQVGGSPGLLQVKTRVMLWLEV